MGKQSDRKKYLANCTKTLQGQLGFDARQFKENNTIAEVKAALKARRMEIDLRLMQSPDEQVGKLACIGNASIARFWAIEAILPELAARIWAELQHQAQEAEAVRWLSARAAADREPQT